MRGKIGAELGTDERAEEREDAGDDPHGKHAGNGGDVAVDFRGLHEDGGADDDADHHRGGLQKSDGAVGRSGQDGSECIMSPMADKKIIAVMGATGAQGGGLVRAILEDPAGGFAARAITRDVNSEKAKALARAGAEVVAGDVDDGASLERAFAGAYGAFCVTFYWDHFSPEKELAHAAGMVQAAKAAKLQHVIWSTLEDTRQWVPLSDNRMPTLMGKYKVPHFDAKGEANHLFTDAGCRSPCCRLLFTGTTLSISEWAPRKAPTGS